MATYCICGQGEVCADPYCEHHSVAQEKEITAWSRFKNGAVKIIEFVYDIYHYNDDPEPVVKDGGTRVIIRPDRIDPI
jgi:hypothetical protein